MRRKRTEGAEGGKEEDEDTQVDDETRDLFDDDEEEVEEDQATKAFVETEDVVLEGEEVVLENEVVLDPRGFPAGQFKKTIEPIVGRVSKKSPLYVRMHTLGRGIQDFVVDEVTEKGVVIKPPWTKGRAQVYRIGERGRSYDVFVHRAYGTRHATVYEGMATPPAHLVEGRWEDADPSADATFLKLLSSFEGIAKLMNIEEPLPPWFWVLAALAFLSPVIEILRLFV